MSISRLLSLILAGIYLLVPLVYYFSGDEESLESFFNVLAFLVLPMVCIWYGDEMGEWMGTMRLHQITSISPGWAVVFMGWIVLSLPVLMFIVSMITDKIFFQTK
jgi:hypothetical protein